MERWCEIYATPDGRLVVEFRNQDGIVDRYTSTDGLPGLLPLYGFPKNAMRVVS